MFFKIVLMLGLGLSLGIDYSTAPILRPVKDSKMSKKRIIDVEVSCNFNQHILSIILDCLAVFVAFFTGNEDLPKPRKTRSHWTWRLWLRFTPVSFLFRILCDELQIHELDKQVSEVGQLWNKESCVHGSEIKYIKSRKDMEIAALLATKIDFKSDFKTFFFCVFFLINHISTRNFWGIIFIHLCDVCLIRVGIFWYTFNISF